jgi:Tfp pilus assembly protein PilN
MARKSLLFLAAALAAAAAVVAALGGWRKRAGAEANGGRERTEQLRREIEAARARLRESIRSQDG